MSVGLILPSKEQKILDNCLDSLIPTIEGKDVVVYVISILAVPLQHPQIRLYRSSEYHPNKYFNKIVKENRHSIWGIINDDLVFTDGWLEDTTDRLLEHDLVSPGFVQSKDPNKFQLKWEETKKKKGVEDVFFGSCYFFKSVAFEKVGYFDEGVVGWYDLDWWWRFRKAGLSVATARKVSVLHLGRSTNDKEKLAVKKRDKVSKQRFIEKFGIKDYEQLLKEMRKVRKLFIFE